MIQYPNLNKPVGLKVYRILRSLPSFFLPPPVHFAPFISSPARRAAALAVLFSPFVEIALKLLSPASLQHPARLSRSSCLLFPRRATLLSFFFHPSLFLFFPLSLFFSLLIRRIDQT